MSSKYQRPDGAYAGVAGANRTKYQDDAAAVPKRAISSAKMDGDLNYIVDAMNETWDHLTAASFSTALPDQAGHANQVPVTNGTATAWQLIGNDNVQNASLGLAKMAVLGGPALVGAGSDGVVAALTVGSGLAVQAGAVDVTVPGVPTGMIAPFAGTVVPAGWFLCAGQAVSRTTYAALFTALGTTYGAGDGTSTFNLPDLRGRSVFGVDNMGGSTANRVTGGTSGITGTTLGAVGGDERLHGHTHTATVTDPGHTHQLKNKAGGGAELIVAFNNNGSGAFGTAAVAGTIVTATTGITVANASTGAGSSQNMPPAMMLNWIVKA